MGRCTCMNLGGSMYSIVSSSSPPLRRCPAATSSSPFRAASLACTISSACSIWPIVTGTGRHGPLATATSARAPQ